MDIFNQQILDNSLQQWAIAVTAVVAIVLVLRLIQRLATRRLAALARLTETRWDDIVVGLIGRTKLLFLFIVGFFVGSLFLELPAHIRSVLSSLLIISLLVQTGIWGVSWSGASSTTPV